MIRTSLSQRHVWLLLLAFMGIISLGLNPLLQHSRAAAQNDKEQDRALAALIRQFTDRTAAGLPQQRQTTGGTTLELKGHFQSVPLARRAAA